MTYRHTSDEQLWADLQLTLRELEAARAKQAEREAGQGPQPAGQPPEQVRRSKLKAMKRGWEARGIPWDQARAVATLGEVELRGIIR
jgi:hypothetical protein